VDLPKTWASVAQDPWPQAEGLDLTPVLEGMQPPWRHEFLVEHSGAAPPAPTFCGVRTDATYGPPGHPGPFMYVKYLTQSLQEELYDLGTDAIEETNQIFNPDYAGVLANLRADDATLCSPPPPSGGSSDPFE
jgi:hypothetical protein